MRTFGLNDVVKSASATIESGAIKPKGPGPVAPVAAELVKGATVAERTQQFPFLWSFLSSFLEDRTRQKTSLRYLLSWMKQAYEACQSRVPSPGQILLLVGDSGTGKTFFAEVLMGKLLGGTERVTSSWKGNAVRVGDESEIYTPTGRSRLRGILVQEGCGWDRVGRTILTLGHCPVGRDFRKLMLDINLCDKFSFLLIDSSVGSVFSTESVGEELRRIVDEELPYLARFLMDVRHSPELVEKYSRYFLRAYRDPIPCTEGGE